MRDAQFAGSYWVTQPPLGGGSAQWIDDLEALASRTGMRELVARAYAHRGKRGDRVAADTARVLAAEVDNPALRRLE